MRISILSLVLFVSIVGSNSVYAIGIGITGKDCLNIINEAGIEKFKANRSTRLLIEKLISKEFLNKVEQGTFVSSTEVGNFVGVDTDGWADLSEEQIRDKFEEQIEQATKVSTSKYVNKDVNEEKSRLVQGCLDIVLAAGGAYGLHMYISQETSNTQTAVVNYFWNPGIYSSQDSVDIRVSVTSGVTGEAKTNLENSFPKRLLKGINPVKKPVEKNSGSDASPIVLRMATLEPLEEAESPDNRQEIEVLEVEIPPNTPEAVNSTDESTVTELGAERCYRHAVFQNGTLLGSHRYCFNWETKQIVDFVILPGNDRSEEDDYNTPELTGCTGLNIDGLKRGIGRCKLVGTAKIRL